MNGISTQTNIIRSSVFWTLFIILYSKATRFGSWIRSLPQVRVLYSLGSVADFSHWTRDCWLPVCASGIQKRADKDVFWPECSATQRTSVCSLQYIQCRYTNNSTPKIFFVHTLLYMICSCSINHAATATRQTAENCNIKYRASHSEEEYVKMDHSHQKGQA
jgi:hypothetical protein